MTDGSNAIMTNQEADWGLGLLALSVVRLRDCPGKLCLKEFEVWDVPADTPGLGSTKEPGISLVSKKGVKGKNHGLQELERMGANSFAGHGPSSGWPDKGLYL